ncbi:MAG: hypothetical protein MJ089_04980 [Ruminococcus sp.]|nr:hypothetical protein [Ruminococcus sp.]
MKVKYSVIPFLPFALAMVIFKLLSIFGLDSNGQMLGMNKMGITYLVIGLTIALFIVCVVINIFDRKTSPVYEVKKNPLVGFLSIAAAAAIVISSIFSLVENHNGTEYYFVGLVTTVFSVPAAIALSMISKSHFSGKTSVKSSSALYVSPAVWGCSELVFEFLNGTKVSVSASDMTGLFCYIFIALYFFSYAMIISRIKGRNPVKACFIYGVPACAVLITYGLYQMVVAKIENAGNSLIINGLCFIVLALFIGSFLLEMFSNYMSKDEVEIVEVMPDSKEENSSAYFTSKSFDELVVSNRAEMDRQLAMEAMNAEENYIDDDEDDFVSDFSDFVMGYDRTEHDEPIPYLTKEEMKNASDFNNLLVTSDAHTSPVIFQSRKKTNKNSRKTAHAPAFTGDISKTDNNYVQPAQVASVDELVMGQQVVRVEHSSKDAVTPDKHKSSNKSMSDVERLLKELESKR